jgi:hypothetical protein
MAGATAVAALLEDLRVAAALGGPLEDVLPEANFKPNSVGLRLDVFRLEDLVRFFRCRPIMGWSSSFSSDSDHSP